MTDYANDPSWADVAPLPVDEGGANPLASIAYSTSYATATGYLRAVMAAEEYSARALSLTQDIISMNPAHYTVWLYRARILRELGSDLEEELVWLNEIALRHLKNYQIWNHRQTVVDRRGSADGETEFMREMLEQDAKNYHVWSYRQWLVRRFGLWQGCGELEFTHDLIRRDVRNNSAWNHRWFLINARQAEGVSGVEADAQLREREVEFAKRAIESAPHNQCPWNYLRATVGRSRLGLNSLKEFTTRFARLDEPDGVESTYALDLLADILAEEDEKQKAAQALDLLTTRYDPLRRNYWSYRKGLLGLESTSVSG